MTAAEPGVFLVRTPDDVQGSLLAHVARRLRAARWCAIEVIAHPTSSIFREVATQLGMGALPCIPSAYAAAIAKKLRSERIAILGALPREGSFDDAVARELVGSPEALLVFATSSMSSAPAVFAAATFDVPAALTTEERVRWLSASVQESEALFGGRSLLGLEDWWRRVTSEGGPRAAFVTPTSTLAVPSAPTELSEAAVFVLTCTALARRSIPFAAFDCSRVDVGVVDELRSARLINQNTVAVVLDRSVDISVLEAQASAETRDLTVRMLLGETGGFGSDPWACARAAELLIDVAPFEADAAMQKAARFARDSRAHAAIEETWFTATARVSGEPWFDLRVRAAERALGAGNAASAERWCESVASVDAGRPRVRLTLARARAELGDLVGARVLLDQIAMSATDDGLRALIAVERGEFREDLYYRLCGIVLEVPTLRSRASDISRLAEHLLGRIAAERGGPMKRLTPDAQDLLMRHRWPGNVRELENILRATSVFSDGDEITLSDLLDVGKDFRVRSDSQPPPSRTPASLVNDRIAAPDDGADVDFVSNQLPGGFAASEGDPERAVTEAAYAEVRQRGISLHDMKRRIERECVVRALDESNGNITRAASLLGMKRPRLSQLAKQYALALSASSDGE